MASFGATEIVKNNAINGQKFNSTFKIKGQIYHKVGSLLPMPNESPKFLQIYFMGSEDARCAYNNLDLFFARRIVRDLDALLNEHNELLKIFKLHMHKLQSDSHAIVTNPDKTPAGEHIRRFNALFLTMLLESWLVIVQLHEKSRFVEEIVMYSSLLILIVHMTLSKIR